MYLQILAETEKCREGEGDGWVGYGGCRWALVERVMLLHGMCLLCASISAEEDATIGLACCIPVRCEAGTVG